MIAFLDMKGDHLVTTNKFKSPFTPKSFPELPEVAGVQLATAEAGIKYQNRTDILLVELTEGTKVAGVFTKSKCLSAPVDWCKKHLEKGTARGILINSGNANAFTGMRGWQAAKRSAELMTNILDCSESEIFLASTGVIGEPMDVTRFESVLNEMKKSISSEKWLDAAKAIMTTDTFPKISTETIQIDGEKIVINGIAKGSGMIEPDMATMLGFIFTNAPISQPVLQELLTESVEKSFNAITVDSDTSTSDTVLLCATGIVSNPDFTPINSRDDLRVEEFSKALERVSMDLAHQIVKDGEGATKFVEIEVKGAEDSVSAKKIAKSIANSPLVKTAFAGEDPNWGRIVMAIGKAGEPADRDRLSIWFDEVQVASQGERSPEYSESEAMRVVKQNQFKVTVDMGLSSGASTIWTCDFTKDYVAINGDYRS